MLSKRICFALLLPILQAGLTAQNYQGAVRGRVTDVSGAGIGGVKVNLSDQATNVHGSRSPIRKENMSFPPLSLRRIP